MTRVTIDDRRLDHLCSAEQIELGVVLRAVQGLGPLAPWWLSDSCRRILADSQPALLADWNRLTIPRSLGSCLLLLANRRPHRLRLLPQAVALPLCWKPDQAHSQRLPPSLIRLADLVLKQFQAEPGVGERKWGLFLHEEAGLANVDLSALDDQTWSSAWGALAAALVLACEETLPDPQVMASLAWDEDFGIGRVECVEAKLELAVRYGAKQFFLPAENQREALQWIRRAAADIQPQFIAPVLRDPAPGDLLRHFFGVCGVPPDLSAPFHKRCVYYQRQTRPRAEQFHWDRLLPDIILQRKEQLRRRYPDFSPTHLVTVISNVRSVVVLGAAASLAEQCLLLFEDNDQQPQIARWKDQVEAKLREITGRKNPTVAAPITIGDRDSDLREIRRHVETFVAGVDPRRIAFDLTPGYKSISLALEEIAPPGSWLLYCRHRQLPPDNRVEPGSENYDCWPKAAGATLPQA